MDFTIYSRSNNDHLYDRMAEFFPAGTPKIKCINFQEWQDASRYIYYIIDNAETDWIFNVDIDCFLFDWEGVIKLYKYMQDNDIVYCGMRDGGVHPGRSWSWCNINPFFNIYNAKKIRELKAQQNLTWKAIEQHQYLPEYEKLKPEGLGGNINNATGEPFHGLFYWLFKVAKGYFMEPVVFKDEITNYLLGVDGKEILLHCWYSRNYDHDEGTKIRIDKLFQLAQKKRNELSIKD
ncbi:MAG: hypothetical protein BGO69_01795 [Bacteroidetes bacterium 46-16]|nr:MAG: hypothetical protein BGO69_01795 [Bacteroidetes bacterium 46-16]